MTPFLILALLAPSHLGAADVLANVRNAISYSEHPAWQETMLTGSATFHDVTSNYKLQFANGGEFRQNIDGKLGQTLGYDGKSFWQIDTSGATRHLAFEDVDRVQTVMMLLTDRWLDPTAPIDTKIEGPDGSGVYTARISLHVSSLEETVRIDPASWLPTSAEFEMASSTTKIVLSDWRTAGSIKVPFLAKVTDEGLTDTYRVEEARRVAQSAPATYSMPNITPDDIAYNPSIPAKLETKRAPSGHVLVHPRINGKDIGWFILDSGADSMIVDRLSADSLFLPKIGKESVVGVGGAVQEPFRTAAEFALGPATMRNVTFLEIDLHDLSDIFKVKLAGIVGFDFFRRFIVQVDLKKPFVEVDNVADFHLQRGDWAVMEFSSGNPAVQATYEGDHKGWFRLDTGANGTVTFHAPIVEKLHMLVGRDTNSGAMAGVGGSTDARVGKIKWFELGGHRFENLVAVFSLAKIGAFADRYLAGNIGQDLMEPFTVVFDFGGSRVAFLPH